MTWQSIMQQDPITIEETSSLDEAIGLLQRYRIATLPVVDARGRYRGLFGILSLVSRLLPRAALLDDHAELTDLGFVHDSLDTLKDRVASQLKEPVSMFMDRELPPLAPGDSVAEILLRLHRHRQDLPVIDPDSGRVLGIVTDRTVLSALAGQAR